jgi:DNA-binding CsgD family transcriptional regulator
MESSAVQDTPSLSYRQRQILDCLIRGYHNKTIAHHLGIEVVTVKMHIGILFRKLGVSNRTEAAVRGLALYFESPLAPMAQRERGFRPRGEARRLIAPRWHRSGSAPGVPADTDRRTRSRSTV